MAVPLPVTEQPLEQPFEAPVLAEAQLLFDLAGVDPLPPIASVVTVDFYLSGRVTNEYSFYQTGEPEAPTQELDNDSGVGMPAGDCPRPGSFFQPVVPFVAAEFFPIVGPRKHPCGLPDDGVVTEPALTSLFEWIDVGSFYWWESPYPILDEIVPYVPPAEPPGPEEFFVPGTRPRVGFDFFLGRERGLACSPIELEVLAPAAVTVAGQLPIVIVTDRVIVQPVSAELLVAGATPAVVVTNDVRVRPAAAAVELEGYAPAIVAPVSVRPAAAAVTITGLAPSVDTGGVDETFFTEYTTGVEPSDWSQAWNLQSMWTVEES